MLHTMMTPPNDTHDDDTTPNSDIRVIIPPPNTTPGYPQNDPFWGVPQDPFLSPFTGQYQNTNRIGPKSEVFCQAGHPLGYPPIPPILGCSQVSPRGTPNVCISDCTYPYTQYYK